MLLLIFASPGFSYEQVDCLRCHREGSGKSVRTINQAAYEHSVHYKEISCTDCHTSIVDDTHMKHRGSEKVDCGTCHDQENRHGMNAQGMEVRPKCHDCHTRHAIMDKTDPDSSVNPINFTKTCSPCHPAQFGDAGFVSWLTSVQIKTHGKQDFSCDFDERDCLGCHQGQGAHGEATVLNDSGCWKCHFPRKDQAGVIGDIHPKPSSKIGILHGVAGIFYGIAALILLLGGCLFFMRRFSTKSGNKKGR